MIVVDIALFICIFMLGVELLGHRKRLDLINDDLEEFDADIGNIKQRCETHKKSIEYLSKSVRELNGVVEAAVKVKEETSDNKPDTKALIGGWDADEAEPDDPAKKTIVDICLNGTYEQKQYLIDVLTLQNYLSNQTQQCIYPWNSGQLQASAMLPPQQCIYPWRQTPTGAILPLWYINRRLEDM